MSTVGSYRRAIRHLVPAGWTLDRLMLEAVDALAAQRGWSKTRALHNLGVSAPTYYRKRRAFGHGLPWCVRGRR